MRAQTVNENIEKIFVPKLEADIKKEFEEKFVGRYFKALFEDKLLLITRVKFRNGTWLLVGTDPRIKRFNETELGAKGFGEFNWKEVFPKKDKIGRTRYI